ncbi:hypothetical protein [Hasllibacter sp. MH4015]|uniref:hypothetical protein n=1 Tax=Hasllibacter sp. MH4015 TaxID=2854029 RepID=UPI001CD6263D|nr:hypothetical protein [Hasllibacter sp. MH4015]
MLVLGRTVLFMVIGLSVVYLCLFFYLRSGARMRLEEDWVQEGRPGDRDAWIDERIEPVAARLRVWLAFFVYVVPIVGVVAFVWITN